MYRPLIRPFHPLSEDFRLFSNVFYALNGRCCALIRMSYRLIRGFHLFSRNFRMRSGDFRTRSDDFRVCIRLCRVRGGVSHLRSQRICSTVDDFCRFIGVLARGEGEFAVGGDDWDIKGGRFYAPSPGSEPTSGSSRTIFTVSRLTATTCPMRRTMYSGSSARLGSLVIPLRLSVVT